jgi:endonuclease YncB( thermonuclease family)
MKSRVFRHVTALAFVAALAAIFGFPAMGTEDDNTEAETVLVVGVSDGDTIKVLGKERHQYRVRLSQIDAPESKQAFGSKAKQALASICFGRRAVLSKEGVDRYGRVLARVRCDGVDAQSHMLRSGMAWVFTRYATDRSLVPLQDEARRKRQGLWADTTPIPPWEFRREQN